VKLSELAALKLLIRWFESHSIGESGGRAAAEYGNVMDCERL
jgi:hypothetical protein